MAEPVGTIALIGPGRAGTTLAFALTERGWEVVGVAGRAPEATSTIEAAVGLGARPKTVAEAGAGADLVVIATPDRAIEDAAVAVAPSLERGALVVHLAGSRGLDALGPLRARRPDVRIGALHPLQSFPSTAVGRERLAGSWAAVAGDEQVAAIAASVGLRPFVLNDTERTRYHAAAVVASNHVVALLGQVERLAASCSVPAEAFGPLVRASVEGALQLGAAAALTGPIQRGDLDTVEAHLQAIDRLERAAYRALAREAARLAGRRDRALDDLLGDGSERGRPPG